MHAIPARAGIGLKPQHYREVLEARPALGFFEVHAENYMGEGGPPHRWLERIRRDYPLSLHGVALSLGSEGPLDREHLKRLKSLIERYEPGLFSEHLAWSTHEDAYLDDLLPLPYTEETLARVCRHIDETQEFLGRRLLLENPSTYLLFEDSTLSETDFLRGIVRRTGCGLLLDVNNVFVSAVNHATDALAYLADFPFEHVGEIHLAGHDERTDDGGVPFLIDAHGSPVADPVWALYAHVVFRAGPKPTLIERDANLPPLPDLVAEAARADAVLGAEACRRSGFVAAAE
ncbi:MAG: DUF692 domain-containing protein [Parvibaculaceae bacterium]